MNFCVRWTLGAVETLDDMIKDLRKSVSTSVEKYAESHDMRITAEMVIDAFVHERTINHMDCYLLRCDQGWYASDQPEYEWNWTKSLSKAKQYKTLLNVSKMMEQAISLDFKEVAIDKCRVIKQLQIIERDTKPIDMDEYKLNKLGPKLDMKELFE